MWYPYITHWIPDWYHGLSSLQRRRQRGLFQQTKKNSCTEGSGNYNCAKLCWKCVVYSSVRHWKTMYRTWGSSTSWSDSLFIKIKLEISRSTKKLTSTNLYHTLIKHAIHSILLLPDWYHGLLSTNRTRGLFSKLRSFYTEGERITIV